MKTISGKVWVARPLGSGVAPPKRDGKVRRRSRRLSPGVAVLGLEQVTNHPAVATKIKPAHCHITFSLMRHATFWASALQFFQTAKLSAGLTTTAATRWAMACRSNAVASTGTSRLRERLVDDQGLRLLLVDNEANSDHRLVVRRRGRG